MLLSNFLTQLYKNLPLYWIAASYDIDFVTLFTINIMESVNQCFHNMVDQFLKNRRYTMFSFFFKIHNG